jgi:sigma-B regulation protein RsbU (phosphoserine phosphatase)
MNAIDTKLRPAPSARNWRVRLKLISDTMREMSRQTDPQEMVRAYASRMSGILQNDRMITLSRRGHQYPEFRVTRDTEWKRPINPWTERDRLPVLRGGLLADLIYGQEPRIIHSLDVAPDDPAAAYLAGQRSLMAIPLFDSGLAMNMVVFLRRKVRGFRHRDLPEHMWLSNLFGRATQSLVLSQQLREACDSTDRELQDVADMQRALLPAELPRIPTMELAVYYQTSRRAGGDYYDFFPLPDGKWGILIADVSGHGTPAAVLMAITHTIAHTYPAVPCPAGYLLTRLNHQLSDLYTSRSSNFVTAFYGIYDPATRRLTYACAGHSPPRLKRCCDDSLIVLNQATGMPLGIVADEEYGEANFALIPGDQIVFYTDGITETFNRAGEMFGPEGLDRVLMDCHLMPEEMIQAILKAVDEYGGGQAPADDRTVLIAKIS